MTAVVKYAVGARSPRPDQGINQGGETPPLQEISSSHSIVISNLAPETEYTYFVTAEDRAAHKVTSPTYSFRTPSLNAPYEETPQVNTGVADQIDPQGVRMIHLHHVLDDLNGDGVADFAVLQPVGGSPWNLAWGLYVVYSNSDGTYSPNRVVRNGPAFSLDNFPVWIPAGDFNQDGFTDLIVVNLNQAFLFHSRLQGHQASYELSQPVVGINDRKNVFFDKATTYYLEGAHVDFNGDGLIDLLVRDQSVPNRYQIIFSNSSLGNYDAGGPFAAIDNFPGYFLGFPDMTGDGKGEIVSYRAYPDKTSFRFYTSPDFSSAASRETIYESPFFGTNTAMYAVDALGDIDGNGVRDLIGITYSGADILHGRDTVLLFNADGSIKQIQQVQMGSNYLTHVRQTVRAGDVNADGVRDLAMLVANAGSPTNASASAIYIYPSKNGTFDLANRPGFILYFPADAVDERSVAGAGHLTVRPRREGNQIKHDLMVRALQPDPDPSTIEPQSFVDLVYKEK